MNGKKFYGNMMVILILFLSVLTQIGSGWCAGEEKVVFINERKQPDGTYAPYGYYDIYIVNYDGADLKKLVENGINPVPSPDGKKIAFIPIVHLENHLGISLIKPDGTKRKDLIQKEKEKRAGFCCLRWSPDGKKIVYVASEMGISDKEEVLSLWIVDVATGEKKQLYSPLHGIPCLSWSPDSQEILVFTIGYPIGRPDEAAIINIRTNERMKPAIDKLNIAPTNMLILYDKRLLYHKNEALWTVHRDGSNNKKLVDVGDIFELGIFSKPNLETLPNNSIRIMVKDSDSKGKTVNLYEVNVKTRSLSLKAKTDDQNFYGYFSHDATKILTVERVISNHPENFAVKDLKTDKVYVLSDTWRVFKDESSWVYEQMNWVMPSK